MIITDTTIIDTVTIIIDDYINLLLT